MPLCDLPKVRKKEMHPLTSSQLKEFLRRAEQDDPFYAPIFYIAFFTGLREAELIGLTWDCIDFDKHTIRVYRQYVHLDYGPRLGQYDFTSLKNGKERTFQVAPSVIQAFRKLRHRQLEQRMRAGIRFSNTRNFVLTRDDGRPVSASTMYHHYKQITDAMGLPEDALNGTNTAKNVYDAAALIIVRDAMRSAASDKDAPAESMEDSRKREAIVLTAHSANLDVVPTLEQAEQALTAVAVNTPEERDRVYRARTWAEILR